MFSEFPTFAETPDSMRPFILSFLSLFLAFSLLAGNRAVRLSGADAIVHEWRADWIGAPWDGESFDKNAVPPAPEFRKEIVLNGRISKAVLHVTGLGFFEFFINGEKVGDDLLCPNETSYSSRPSLGKGSIPMDDSRFRGFRVLYLSYDVTRMLHKGGNVLGALLGNGFFSTDAARWVASYGTPRLLCQLELTYRDGRQETIVSGKDWEVRKSGILQNDLYFGETYDARPEVLGPWEHAVLKKAPDGRLEWQDSPADKVMEVLKPVSVRHLDDGTWEVDFDDYVSGWVRLRGIRAEAGTRITLSFPTESAGNGVERYICRGGGVEEYAPRFTWFVFRKVLVDGWPGELRPDHVRAEVIRSDVPTTGRFRCSNELINRIEQIWWRSQGDNMHLGVATDCPHREKGPYTGDGQVACVTVMHHFGAREFYRKWLRDMVDCQDRETGYVPNGAPWHPGCGGGVAWGAAMNIIPWEHYLHYGDLSVLEENFEPMLAQLRFMESWRTEEGIMEMKMPSRDKPVYWMNLGEWCPPYGFPDDRLVHTYFLWKCAVYTAKAARALGKEEEARHCDSLAGDVAEAFHRVFYNPETHSYGHNDGSNVFALAIGLPEPRRSEIVETLRREIEGNGGHLNTGIFGTQLFFEVLCDNGLSGLAYEAMIKEDQPGYGWWLTQDARTTWERWDGKDSHNHPMFGGGLVWLYRKVAGVQADESDPGYRHVIFRPQPVGDLTWASYETETPYGKVSASWKIRRGRFIYKVHIPRGTRGSVWMPGSDTPVELGPGTRRLVAKL